MSWELVVLNPVEPQRRLYQSASGESFTHNYPAHPFPEKAQSQTSELIERCDRANRSRRHWASTLWTAKCCWFIARLSFAFMNSSATKCQPAGRSSPACWTQTTPNRAFSGSAASGSQLKPSLKHRNRKAGSCLYNMGPSTGLKRIAT